MLTAEERKARYEKTRARGEMMAKLKRAKRDMRWNSKPIDNNPIGELYHE